jgi:hypothetical protein
MTVLSWNIRGLNRAFKQKEVRNLIQRLNLTVVDVHEQVLTFKVCPSSSKDPWLFFAVYGANQGPDRHKLLQNLEVIKRCYGYIPWLLAGDFNVIGHQEEKCGDGAMS